MLAPPPLPRTKAAALRDLESPKAQVRASAVQDLVRHARADEASRAEALPLFERALADDAPVVRSAAAVALADIDGVEAVPALLRAVDDGDAHVRQMAISALGEIGDDRARARLERALTDDRPEMRYQSLIAFARVAKEDAAAVATALARALADDDDAIRYIALRLAEEHHATSDNLAKRARGLLADENPKVALVAAILMARAEDADARAIVLKVAVGDFRGGEREDEQAAIELCGELAMKEATPHLEKRAFGIGRFVGETYAWHAKIALARMRHERAVAEIVADLTSWRRQTRQAAVVAAGRARIASARATIAAMDESAADPDLVADALAELAK
jgi:hypothetical protein